MSKNFSGFSHITTSENIEEYKLLKNNLRVLVLEDHTVPVVTVMVTYHVGSRNEAIGYTGSTHILEHLMFKESKKHGRNFWVKLMDKGAQQNATTWLDRTNYYHTVPKEHTEEAISFEADRMRSAIFRQSDLDSEMTVVRNEFEIGENKPAEILDKNIWATAYQAHPYHHSTIGWRSDIENVPLSRLKQFYDDFYWPNNATLTIIGDISTKDVLAIIKKYFGVVSKSQKEFPKVYTSEPKQEGERHVVVSRAGNTQMVAVAHKRPEGLSKDTYPLQVLSVILAEGKTSRLHRLLIDTGLATDVSPYSYPHHDPGLFINYVTLTHGTSHEKVKKVVLDCYEEVKQKGVTSNEVEKAISGIRSAVSFSRDGSFSIAGSINEALAIGDWKFYAEFLKNIEKVTDDQVKEVIQKYFITNNMTTGYFIGKSTI